MAAENTSTDKLVVHHNSSAPAPKRITEEQFEECASDWLALAKLGQQIIVVDVVTEAPAAMVIGMNGVLFQLPDDPPPTPPEEKAAAENKWIK